MNKHSQNEKTEEIFRKRMKWNGGKKSIRYRVQNIGYKDVQKKVVRTSTT